MQLLNTIQQLAAEYAPEFISVRQHLHQHPELSYQEFETVAYVEAQLQKMGISATKMAGTGLLATIEGVNPTSRVIALRADMDALPITEG
ncbi:MAG: amidohydrolase, partial [Chitinophagaceae bacterium]